MLLVAGSTLGLLALLPSRSAEAHSAPYDSVDGCEIRWEDQMRWDTYRQLAQNAWESLAYDDCVDLAPDAWYTTTDLKWIEGNSSSSTAVALWDPRGGIVGDTADEIWVNGYWMERISECERRHAAMYALGRAHGIGSNTLGASVMNPNSGLCTLQEHDIHDYEALWGDSDPPPLPPHDPTTHMP